MTHPSTPLLNLPLAKVVKSAGAAAVASVALLAALVPWSAAVPATQPASPAPARRSPATTAAARPAPPATGPQAPLRRPMPQPVPDDPAGVTDEQIGKAIDRGVVYLAGFFGPPGAPAQFEGQRPRSLAWRGRDESFDAGMDGMAVYALLQCGLATHDPRLDPRRDDMKRLLDGLKRYDLGQGAYQTYARGIRATTLAVYNRPEDRDVLKADAHWLVSVCDGGAYTYSYHRSVTPPPSDYPASLTEEVGKLLTQRPGADAPAAPGADSGYPGAPPTGTAPPAPGPRPPAPKPRGVWDNSNSQYGLLGVWSGAEAGVEVPESYWAMVDRHWADTQGAEGVWGYGEPGDPAGQGTLSMTCAGLASSFVTHDYLVPAVMAERVGRDPYSPHVRRCLRWFEEGKNAMTFDQDAGNGSMAGFGYVLYGLERVGLASGYKHFGQHDWYRVLARNLVAMQHRDGSWGDGPLDTSYCLLCLARGRHPIVMAKLRFDGTAVFREDDPNAPAKAGPAVPPRRPTTKPSDKPGAKPAGTPGVKAPPGKWVGYWANRPRDAAGLARYAGRQLERQFNWEVVNLTLDWTDWTDSPVLELASHRAPHFTDEDLSMLRQYVQAGGLLFTQADGASPEFNDYAPQLAHDLFPAYELVDVPANHPLYTNETVYNIDPRPPLKMVSNGSRVLMLHSPTDLTRFLQSRDEIRHKDAYQVAINLFVYAAGKRDFRNRVDTAWVWEPKAVPVDTVNIARATYGGNWDPEPLAWTRYSHWLWRKTGTRLVIQMAPLETLGRVGPGDLPLAHLTGTTKRQFTAAEAASVRDYVESGGVLLVDSCGGTGTFDQGAEALLAAAFPGKSLAPLPANHPLLRRANPGTDDVTKPLVRQGVALRYGRGAGVLKVISAGKGHVLYTPLDLTSGLLDTHTLGILGYEPAYAQALLKNILFWTTDGQAEQ